MSTHRDPPADGRTAPRWTVVVPTHGRRDTVVADVRALDRQRDAPPFEVVVVVDGDVDGTAEALRALSTSFPLQVLDLPRSGAAVARNRGAAAASGELLLFLDDDMEADPELLAVHDRAHAAGAGVVLGHVPLHPESPESFLADGMGRWAEWRRRTLAAASEPLAGSELLTGHFSISRRRFEQLGGFDATFNPAGEYGREDTDFGVRLARSGAAMLFEPRAVSWHRYEVGLRAYLRQRRQNGRATVRLMRKHPDLPDYVVRPGWRMSRRDRWLGRWLEPLVRGPVLALLGAGVHHQKLERLFFWSQWHAYWRGVREAGGYPEARPVRVLAYHSLAATGEATERHRVPAARFARQLRTLRRLGFRFVSPEEVVRLLAGAGGVPRGALLLTFDDAYADLAADGLPVLRELGAPAAAFVVTGRLGGDNAWDADRGAPRRRLCGADELRALVAGGVELGSHGRSHAALDRLAPAQLDAELAGSAEDLAAAGFGRPRLLAYPYGRSDESAREAARRAGYALAFGIRSGLVTAASDPFDLPRIEVRSEHRTGRLILRLLWPPRRGGPRR